MVLGEPPSNAQFMQFTTATGEIITLEQIQHHQIPDHEGKGILLEDEHNADWICLLPQNFDPSNFPLEPIE